uniref:Protein kinase n=1 Tax=Pithovirus LCPAC201 TaxID=2506591 RepID=A0A481Z4J3_9VIRU|nr:MAG: protein kinase [Pithovirus LCPAC201]
MLANPNFIQVVPQQVTLQPQNQRFIYRSAPGQTTRQASANVIPNGANFQRRPVFENPVNTRGQQIIAAPTVTGSMPVKLRGMIATTNEIYQANQKAQTIAVTADARAKVAAFHQQQRTIEKAYFDRAQVCPIGIQKNLRDKLSKIEPQEFKALIQDKFYDPSVMNAAMCVTESISYTPPIEDGGVASNFRIKRWIKNLNRIGAESVEGFALRGDLDRSKDTFIVKSPRDPNNPMLLHEYFVGVYGLNQTRAIVPNFAYVLGGFRCSMPIISDKTNKVSAWCNNEKYPIDYVVYENVAPAETMKEWVIKSCNFKDWLSYYLQILYATQVAVEMTDYTHYDLHDDNVLRRKIVGSTGTFSIPYRTEKGTEYLITDAVATIIDYGLAHIEYQGHHFGVYDRLPWAVLPTRSFPLHDAYKFLLMSMRTMLQSRKMDCFNKAAQILQFFNNQESAMDIINKQAQTYYYLPYNQKTANLKIYDLTKFIREIFDTSSILVSSKPAGRVVGCRGTDVCINSDTVFNKIGLTGSPIATTMFDFYDLIHRFSREGKWEEVKRIKAGFNYKLASDNSKPEYNISRFQLITKHNNLVIYVANGQPLSIILSSSFLKLYRNYISNVAAIFENFQELTMLYKTLIFAAQNYSDTVTIKEVTRKYSDLKTDHNRLWAQIISYIKTDNTYIQSLLNNPTAVAQINQAILSNKSLSWWWDFFPELMSVIQ